MLVLVRVLIHAARQGGRGVPETLGQHLVVHPAPGAPTDGGCSDRSIEADLVVFENALAVSVAHHFPGLLDQVSPKRLSAVHPVPSIAHGDVFQESRTDRRYHTRRPPRGLRW